MKKLIAVHSRRHVRGCFVPGRRAGQEADRRGVQEGPEVEGLRGGEEVIAVQPKEGGASPRLLLSWIAVESISYRSIAYPFTRPTRAASSRGFFATLSASGSPSVDLFLYARRHRAHTGRRSPSLTLSVAYGTSTNAHSNGSRWRPHQAKYLVR